MLRSINLNFSNLCNDQIVRILKDSKANITPTHLRELIQLGQNVNQTCTKGLTPLHYCCLYKKPDLIYVLVENFADIYIKDKNNRSPLYYAVETNNSKIIKLLLCKANKKKKS